MSALRRRRCTEVHKCTVICPGTRGPAGSRRGRAGVGPGRGDRSGGRASVLRSRRPRGPRRSPGLRPPRLRACGGRVWAAETWVPERAGRPSGREAWEPGRGRGFGAALGPGRVLWNRETTVRTGPGDGRENPARPVVVRGVVGFGTEPQVLRGVRVQPRPALETRVGGSGLWGRAGVRKSGLGEGRGVRALRQWTSSGGGSGSRRRPPPAPPSPPLPPAATRPTPTPTEAAEVEPAGPAAAPPGPGAGELRARPGARARGQSARSPARGDRLRRRRSVPGFRRPEPQKREVRGLCVLYCLAVHCRAPVTPPRPGAARPPALPRAAPPRAPPPPRDPRPGPRAHGWAHAAAAPTARGPSLALLGVERRPSVPQEETPATRGARWAGHGRTGRGVPAEPPPALG